MKRKIFLKKKEKFRNQRGNEWKAGGAPNKWFFFLLCLAMHKKSIIWNVYTHSRYYFLLLLFFFFFLFPFYIFYYMVFNRKFLHSMHNWKTNYSRASKSLGNCDGVGGGGSSSILFVGILAFLIAFSHFSITPRIIIYTHWINFKKKKNLIQLAKNIILYHNVFTLIHNIHSFALISYRKL